MATTNIFADYDEKTPWGIFVFDKEDSGLFTIYTKEKQDRNGHGYWVGTPDADYGYRLMAGAESGEGNNNWQKFQVLNQDDGSVVFKTIHEKYVKIEPWSGHMRMIGNSDSITEDTKFIPECV